MANITGTDGNDIFGRDDNPLTDDTFLMGAGNDFAFGNYGADGFFGGEGLDTVSYRYAAEAVVLDLALGGTGGMADGDSYNSIERIFGSNFDDSITGDGGANLLYGGLGNDIINGGGGADRLFGGAGSDTLNGGTGNDYIEGGAGGDFIDGGAGIDTVGFATFVPIQNGDIPNTEGVTVNLNAVPPQGQPLADDFANAAENNDAENDFYISIENVSGSNFDDNINGNDSANVLNGRAGDDSISGGFGDDKLIGGLGDDDLFGGDGVDFLIGGSGQDELFGGDGNDKLTGGLGDDRLFGGNGNDFMVGGDGDDEFNGGAGNDRIFLGDGADFAQGGDGNDFFYLSNDGVTDEIYGGATNFEGGTTDNGFDTVSYVHATAGVEVYLGGFVPFRPPEPTTQELPDMPLEMAVPEDDILIDIERVIGSNFDDAIYGGFGDEVIIGGNGDDILEGGGGRDRLIGGNGADTFEFVIGGSDTVSVLDFSQGVDQIIFKTFDDTLTEADILATIVDYGVYFVFEFGLVDAPVEQRFAVIKEDADTVLTVDDFTIEIIEDLPLPVDPPRNITEAYAENIFTDVDMVVFAEFDALL